jgi:hypothetical protein
MQGERMVVIKKGNPLITNQNPTGVHVVAGKRLTFSFVGLNDGHPACRRAFSFVPEADKRYVLRASNDAAPFSSSQDCNVTLMLDISPDEATTKVSTFQIEACSQK